MTTDIFSLIFDDENEYNSFKSVDRMVKNAKNVSNRLSKIRKEKFPSISEFSNYSNLKEETIREFEQGGGAISLPALRRYASSLSVEFEIKLVGDVEVAKTGTGENYAASQSSSAIAEIDYGEIYYYLGQNSGSGKSKPSNFHKQSKYV